MFVTGQEQCFLLFCVRSAHKSSLQSAEEVWNANFMRIEKKKEMKRKRSLGWAGRRLKERKRTDAKIQKRESWECVLGVRRQTDIVN